MCFDQLNSVRAGFAVFVVFVIEIVMKKCYIITLANTVSHYVAARRHMFLLHGKIGILEGFFGPSSVHRSRTHIVLA